MGVLLVDYMKPSIAKRDQEHLTCWYGTSNPKPRCVSLWFLVCALPNEPPHISLLQTVELLMAHIEHTGEALSGPPCLCCPFKPTGVGYQSDTVLVIVWWPFCLLSSYRG